MSYPTVLLDLDDTCIATCTLYLQARTTAAHLIARELLLGSMATLQVETRIQTIDRRQVAAQGFAKERFPESLRLAYTELCAERCETPRPYLEQVLRGVGYAVYSTAPAVFPDVPEAIARLETTHDIILLTKGDPDVQYLRLEQTGLRDLIPVVSVVPEKTVATYHRIIVQNDLDPATTWMIGDSIASDINPALTAGLRAIQVRYTPATDWEYDTPPVAVGTHVIASSLTAAVRVVQQALAQEAA